MSYSFRVSNTVDSSFDKNYKINNIILNYNTEKYFSSFTEGNKTLICYGYCFDVRSPNKNIEETLSNLLESDNITNDVAFLNGHFILIIKIGSALKLYTDASSLTPIYFSSNDQLVTNILHELKDDYAQLNPAYSLNLNTFHVNRIQEERDKYNSIDNDNLTDYLISLIINQYKYFSDKNIAVPFKADNYTKSIFAILSPILYGNNIVLKSSKITDKDKVFSKIFAKEFRMNLNDSLDPEVDSEYICKNNLSNFNAIYSQKQNIKEVEWFSGLYKDYNINLLNHEYNLMNLNIKSNSTISDNHLIYEPLNSREILNVFIELSLRLNFKIHIPIIDNLKSSLKYFNFSNGKNLSEINLELKNKLNKLIDNSMESPTQKFLLDVKTSNYRVSQNLAGKIKNEEIIVYPARQKISKTNSYTIDYMNSEEGIIFIESFYKNEKNSHRIKVWINDEEFNIKDLYGGIYFYVKDQCNIIMKYTLDYEGLSWQKAGTLSIKKI